MCVFLTVALALAGVSTGAQSQPQPPASAPVAQPPPGTDIHLLRLRDGRVTDAKPEVIAASRGYENQPAFTPDGRALLFTANRDGKQTDIFEFDLTTRTVAQRVSTPEGEYSATITPGAKTFSVIRVERDNTQRLWQFDRDGANPRLVLADIKPVGYHVWVDADTLVLFVLGPPSTLRLARVSTGQAEVIATDIGRSIQRVPGRRAVSFVQRETAQTDAAAASGQTVRYWVKELDVDSRKITPLVMAVAGSSERDTAWLNDGTLLMSSGTRILAWKRGDKDWREIADVAAHGLGAVTRMAVSPDGSMLAIVVNEPAAR